MKNTDDVVKLLNDVLEKDNDAISCVILTRTKCNEAIQDHPVIQVNEKGEVGALGLVNGILETLGLDRVAAVFDDNGKLVGFANYSHL